MSAPEKVFRAGNVSASIFVDEYEYSTGLQIVRRVALSRRYRGGYAKSLRRQDIPDAIEVLTEAWRYLGRRSSNAAAASG
jgi:hypothetical protein